MRLAPARASARPPTASTPHPAAPAAVSAGASVDLSARETLKHGTPDPHIGLWGRLIPCSLMTTKVIGLCCSSSTIITFGTTYRCEGSWNPLLTWLPLHYHHARFGISHVQDIEFPLDTMHSLRSFQRRDLSPSNSWKRSRQATAQETEKDSAWTGTVRIHWQKHTCFGILRAMHILSLFAKPVFSSKLSRDIGISKSVAVTGDGKWKALSFETVPIVGCRAFRLGSNTKMGVFREL
jgi:hypothetical protein